MATTLIRNAFKWQDERTALEFIYNTFLTHCLTSAGLAIGSTGNKEKVANGACSYAINGIIYTLSANANGTALAGGAQATGTYCKYLVSVNASGTVTITAGVSASTAAEAELPALPSANCPLGYVQIYNNSGSNFIPGTTALDASGITATYVNLMVMPTQ
jgi:hypothetical protein